MLLNVSVSLHFLNSHFSSHLYMLHQLDDRCKYNYTIQRLFFKLNVINIQLFFNVMPPVYHQWMPKLFTFVFLFLGGVMKIQRLQVQ